MSSDPETRVKPAIRELEKQDVLAVEGLVDELGYPADRAALTARLDRAASDPSISVFVAIAGERIVGFASLHVLHLIERPPLGRLSAIVVTESARRLGIGSSLLDRVGAAAAAAGCDRLEVTSGERREDAHAFYRALGFDETSKRFIRSLAE